MMLQMHWPLVSMPLSTPAVGPGRVLLELGLVWLVLRFFAIYRNARRVKKHLRRRRLSFRQPQSVAERLALTHDVPLELAEQVAAIVPDEDRANYAFYYAHASGERPIDVADNVARRPRTHLRNSPSLTKDPKTPGSTTAGAIRFKPTTDIEHGE